MAEQNQPPQQQDPPGDTADMDPRPQDEMAGFAKEGADVAIAHGPI